MAYPRVKPRAQKDETTRGVYANLDDLIRLQYKAQGFSFLPKQPVHSILAGRHASRLRGRGLNFEEIRHYLPGDDIRNMDWKVTARVRKPHVRVYTEERDRSALYVVDQRISMFFGTQVNMKSVTAAELAALGAWRSFSMGDRPGGIVFNDTEKVEIAPHRSRQRVMQMLKATVEQNHALRIDAGIPSNPEMLNEAIERAAFTAKHDFLVCIISDFSGADEDTEELIKRMAAHNDVILCLIHDPIAERIPEAGRLVVSDGHRQIELDTTDVTFRERLPAILEERLSRLTAKLRHYGVPVLPVHTAEGVAEQVRKLLGYGQR